jgi:hypothetical protein
MIDILISILSRGVEIFTAPFSNFELLWTVIPVYFQWFLTSTFQEKKGTAFGNAMVNGFVCMWVGLDWSKTLYQEITTGSATIEAFRLVLSAALMIYGLIIFIEAFRGKRIVKYIGRVREVYYFVVVLTPVFYTIVPIDFITIGAILLGLPISYLISELLARKVPYPGGEEEAEPIEDEISGLDDSSSSTTDPFATNNSTQTNDPFTTDPFAPNQTNSQTNTQSYNCPTCGSPMQYVQQHGKYFCRRCNKYI